MGGEARPTINLAWEAAVHVTAGAYRVDVGVLGAPGRGRGPRPPRDLWLPRKIAVYVAVLVADRDYAELGRHIGLSRDTVSSHCAEMRRACDDDPDLEQLVNGLEASAALRAKARAAAPAIKRAGDPAAAFRAALHAYADELAAALAPASSDTSDVVPFSRKRDQKPQNAKSAA